MSKRRWSAVLVVGAVMLVLVAASFALELPAAVGIGLVLLAGLAMVFLRSVASSAGSSAGAMLISQDELPGPRIHSRLRLYGGIIAPDLEDVEWPDSEDAWDHYEAVAQHGGIHAGWQIIEITVQNPTTQQIIVDMPRIEILQREDPAVGIHVGDQSGGFVLPRLYFFTVPLHGKAKLADFDFMLNERLPTQYTVAPGDSEVFRVEVLAQGCLLTWSAFVDWVANGEPGTTALLDGHILAVSSTEATTGFYNPMTKQFWSSQENQ